MPSAAMLFVRASLLTMTVGLGVIIGCKGAAPEIEIRHDLKYFAAFSSPAILTVDDEKRFTTVFQSKYKNRVVLLKPVAAQAYLGHLSARASFFAVIRLGSQRETKIVAREIEQALGGQAIAIFPIVEAPASQDNFSGQYFYLALEKRHAAFAKLPANQKAELMRAEAEELGRDRNLLSYFSANMLVDSPYHTLHLMGFSGAAESEYQTLDGFFGRAIRKLDTADTALLEKIR